MALVDLASCLLNDLSKRLLSDCSSECPNESNQEIIEDFRLTESLLSQYFMIRNCDVENGTTTDLSKIELALNNLIEKYQCLGCQSYTPESSDVVPPENCDIFFGGSCENLAIVSGSNVVSISYDSGRGDTGVPCPLGLNNIGNQVGNSIDAKYLCISNEDVSEKSEECNMTQVNENTLVYVYYDGTSLGTAQVQNAYSAIMDWLHQQPGFTPVTSTPTGTAPNTINTGENVFHTIMAGERWLDWGMQPITGNFSNNNVTNPSCQFIAQGDQVNGADRIYCNNLPTDVSNWSYDTASVVLPISGVTQTVHQFYDTVTGTYLGEDVGDFSVMLGGACDGQPCDPALGCFVANAAGLNVWMGPPPAAPVSNDVLVIIFADESNCMYHGRPTSATMYTQTFINPSATSATTSCPCTDAGLGFSGGDVIPPTGIFKNDYDEYVSQYTTRQAAPGAGTYRCFIYPSCASGGALRQHMPFPLHVVAAIDSGDASPADGLFDLANLPASSLYDDSRGCSTSGSAPGGQGPHGGGKLILLRGTDTNPYYSANYGGLDQKGWGYNSEALSFSNSIFENDLEVFLSDGVATCSGLDCLSLRILEADNPATPVIGEIVQVDGVPYTTDALGYISVPTLSAGTHTIGYANSECYSLVTAGNCTQYIITAYKDTETYDTCVSFSDVQCGCGPSGGLSPDIVIHVGSRVPLSSGGLIGTITNETTGVVTDITGSMISGPDADGNYKVTVPFANTPNDDIPDGRYTILLYGIGDPFVEYKECRLILCESATIIQDLFKKFVSNKDCCPCEKPFEDFVQAYALFRALKIVGVNDCEYETFIDENITKLQALLVTAKAGNCKDC